MPKVEAALKDLLAALGKLPTRRTFFLVYGISWLLCMAAMVAAVKFVGVR